MGINFATINKMENYSSAMENKQEKVSEQDKQNGKNVKIKNTNKKAERIIEKCIWQNDIFSQLFKQKKWRTFHSSHYDWWAFPIDQFSSYKDEYKVDQKQQQVMRNCSKFIQALRTNAIMVCWAWGYDLQKGQLLNVNENDQSWHNWPIRLYKMTRSLQIFGLNKQFRNAVNYGKLLLQKNHDLRYGHKNLNLYFKLRIEKLQL